MFRLALLSCLLCACAAVPVARMDPLPRSRFSSRPMHVVASTSLAPECRAAVYAAAAWFAQMGASIDVTWANDTNTSIAVEPGTGQVSVHRGIPSTPTAAAETYVWRTVGGAIERAEVVVGPVCSPWVMSHELGHAMGLEHHPSREALMYFSLEFGRWGLTPTELAHVRD